MRVFVTGATGFIGSAAVPELLDAGHEIVGLARSEEAAARLTAAGVEPHRGSLDDLDSLTRGAVAADAVVHLAFIHDFAGAEGFAAACAADLRAIETIGAALEGTGKLFAIASGAGGLRLDGRFATEEDEGDLSSPLAARRRSEIAALALADRGVRPLSFRFPPTVHGRGDQGFIRTLVNIAREKGTSAYVGDGANRWTAVHRGDAGRLVRLALDAAPAGVRLHVVDDEAVPFRAIAESIGRQLGLPVTSLDPEDAPAHFGFVAHVATLDMPASSAVTRKLVGWEPVGPGLLADLAEGHYFAS
ncbi:hypothetical protein OK074_6763 [Actinobacteria bacterium OK074]|nr:hypothetical protein OK074_6763 [Actinobacteria bacterium OK074]